MLYLDRPQADGKVHMNLEERLQVLRQEHAKCKQQIAAFEAQALRIEGAMSLVSEMLAQKLEVCPQPESLQ
jgi:hypothetical protein